MEKLTPKISPIMVSIVLTLGLAAINPAVRIGATATRTSSYRDAKSLLQLLRTPIPAPPVNSVVAAAPRRPHADRYDQLILEYSNRYGVEPELVKAVIHAESNFNRQAVSRRGARGLMQLMPRTARSYGARRLDDPRENIHAGVRHLKVLLDRFKSVRLAVAAYNAGATAVRRHRGLPPYGETRRYVAKVLRFRAHYRAARSLA